MRRFFLVLFFLIGLTGCIVDEPKIDIRDIRIDGISEGKITLKVILDVYNPNSFDIGIRLIEYRMYYDKNLFSEGIWEGDEKLKAKSGTGIPIVVSADETMVAKFITLVLRGKIQEIQNKINVEGKVVLYKFGKNFVFDFKWKYRDKKESPQGNINDKKTQESSDSLH